MEAERSQLNCDHTDVWECCKGILKSSVQRLKDTKQSMKEVTATYRQVMIQHGNP